MSTKTIPTRRRGPTAAFVATCGLLILGLIPTAGGGRLRSALRSLHCANLNRTERAAASAGYYSSLIEGPGAARDDLTLALLGKAPGWLNFIDIDAARYLNGQFLQFELKADVRTSALGSRFTTNRHGLRDRDYTIEKAPGVFRIALLGSSIDMGWGVDTARTYENRLEDWLNAHAARRGLPRRFEVLNFAMAAYSPLHRLKSYESKARAFKPDLVIYSATRLDPRLLQIHIAGLLQEGTDLTYEFVRKAVAESGLASDSASRPHMRREELRETLGPRLRAVEQGTLQHLAELCQKDGTPLLYLMIPRASEDDLPESRRVDIARMGKAANELGLPVLDVSGAFDAQDPSAIEIAPWDDHPNDYGHGLLFRALARRIAADPAVYEALFGAAPPEADEPAAP